MENSFIYEGTVRHRRFLPVENTFRYRIFMMYLDLAEIEALSHLHPLWSVQKSNVAAFWREDYLGDPRISLDTTIREEISEHTGRWPQGPIRMLTHLRYMGYCFNPVSVYYCFSSNGNRLETIVANIQNTPWLERYAYVLDENDNLHSSSHWRRFKLEKKFHVSPFMDMAIHYDWRFRVPDEKLSVHLINHQGEQKLFDATLSLHRRNITPASLSKVLLTYPLMTAKVTAMIYWQALRLLLKGAPFFTHPAKRAA